MHMDCVKKKSGHNAGLLADSTNVRASIASK